MSQVEKLFAQTIQTFASELHVSEMFVFGSYEQKKYDRYSDVDVHVVTQNFDATMEHLGHCLSDIGQVLVAFPLAAQVGYAAYMVLFEDYPLYTKLDINIADTEKSTPFSDKACVYRKDMLPPHRAPTFLPSLFKEPLNTLYGHYLGAIRYMKYRKREKHFSAYKFYRAQLDSLLLKWYQEATHDFSIERLGILEYQLLDTHEESTKLKRYLYPENEKIMDILYLELLQKATCEVKSSINEEHEKVFKFIIDFLRNESLHFS